MKSIKKMIDWLYRTDDCSDFQKGLRFLMWSNQVKRLLNDIGNRSYKLKKYSLYDELTKI